MAWLFHDFNRECCLTCQYFKTGRRMKSMGRMLYIEYDAASGACRLFQDFPRNVNCRPTTGSWCHYKRWVELPDPD